VKDVEIWLTPEAANYAKERKRKKDEKLTFNKDGSAVLYLPEAVPYEIIKWMMSECGRAKVLEPADLAKEIARAADLVSGMHRK
jgi:hypothetical protein